MCALKTLWEKWKVIAHKIGDFQARVLLSIFYFVVFGPFAVGLRILSNPLRIRVIGAHGWLKRPEAEGDALTLARRQF